MEEVAMLGLSTMLSYSVAETWRDLAPGSSWTSLTWPREGKTVAAAVSSGDHTMSLQRT